MEWLGAVNTASCVVIALALVVGVVRADRIISRYWIEGLKRRETREEEIQRLNTRHKTIINEVSLLAREMEQLWMCIPAMAVNSKPEGVIELKAVLKEGLDRVEEYFQNTQYDFKRRLFSSLDLAADSAGVNKNGWIHEMSMYAALEFLRATSHVEDEFTEEMVFQSRRFLQFRASMHRAYETSFRELARIRRLQCANL